MGWLQSWGNRILDAIPNILAAILILVVGYFVAKLAEWLVNKLIKATHLDEKINKWGLSAEESGSTVGFIGKLVFAIVFILFLPAVFARLGMSQVADPINGMVSRFIQFIPNLIAAALILFIGLFVAKIVRQLVTPLLAKAGVDKIQNKAGVKGEDRTRLSTVLGYVVYVLILIPIAIAALEALGISAISAPAVSMLNKIFDFIPQLFVAIIIVIIGVFIGRLVGTLLASLLAGVGADNFIQRLLPDNSKTAGFSFSKIIGKIVTVLIVLFLTVEAFNVLGLGVLKTIGGVIIGYLPHVLAALIILAIAFLLAQWAAQLLNKRAGNTILPSLVKALIYGVAAFMIFEQLGIANNIVVRTFQLLILGLAIAFGLAFGLGGRDFAARTLKKMENTIEDTAKETDDKDKSL